MLNVFDLADWIYRYYIYPIIYDTSYNPVDTITWAIILGLAILALIRLFRRWGLSVDERLVLSTLPYILAGSSSEGDRGRRSGRRTLEVPAHYAPHLLPGLPDNGGLAGPHQKDSRRGVLPELCGHRHHLDIAQSCHPVHRRVCECLGHWRRLRPRISSDRRLTPLPAGFALRSGFWMTDSTS